LRSAIAEARGGTTAQLERRSPSSERAQSEAQFARKREFLFCLARRQPDVNAGGDQRGERVFSGSGLGETAEMQLNFSFSRLKLSINF